MDLLTEVDGQAITYDASGNPTSYFGRTMTWTNGRQLKTSTTHAFGAVLKSTYTYDADGIRKTKTVPINRRGLTCTYTFVTQNGKVVRQSWRTESIDFFYDESGRPFAMTYQRANDAPQTYYYVLNLQGDVVKLVDVSGAEVASYEYDAWGRVLSVEGDMAGINPLRYRGYYYDSETGFYYLQSRYYDPTNHRFINADSYASTNATNAIACNMFAYCGNNPIKTSDPTGEFFLTVVATVAAVALCAVAMTGCSSNKRSSARSDLSKAPNLDINSARPETYNCYGNGIGKQIFTNPTGYSKGDSTAKTFEAVKSDLGGDRYVRRLDSIDSPIGTDEFRVALKCGPMDYHFIRQDENGWYNKSGAGAGLYVNESVVTSDVWYAMWAENGTAYYSPDVYYDDETIYFAVKIGWDKS